MGPLALFSIYIMTTVISDFVLFETEASEDIFTIV